MKKDPRAKAQEIAPRQHKNFGVRKLVQGGPSFHTPHTTRPALLDSSAAFLVPLAANAAIFVGADGVYV